MHIKCSLDVTTIGTPNLVPKSNVWLTIRSLEERDWNLQKGKWKSSVWQWKAFYYYDFLSQWSGEARHREEKYRSTVLAEVQMQVTRQFDSSHA